MVTQMKYRDSKPGGGRPGPRRTVASFVAALLWLAAAGPPAQAQEKDQEPPIQSANLNDLSLEELLHVKITAAAQHAERLQESPASVTVVTAEEIRRFGYRTLAEALSYVRGLYTTDDHTYTYLGARGFSIPGDYESRIILMINGHNISERILDEAIWYRNDFPVDMDLVERIEISRGPSSALYGGNGMLATINVVTRRPNAGGGTEARLEVDSLGERKVEANTSVELGKGATLLFATSVFNNSGPQTVYFPEFDAPETNFGRAIHMDGEKGYHAFADLTWGNWEILAVAGDRVKVQPVSWGNSVFNDPGTRAEDSRGFLDISYVRELAGDRMLTWHTSYDEYRYRGIYHYVADYGTEDNREHDYGDWIGSELAYRFPDFARGYLTVGGEVNLDLRALMNVFDVSPKPFQMLSINPLDRWGGVFAQQEWAFGQHWALEAGLRFDWSWLKRNAFSPQAALIYQPSAKADLKFIYGRGFRNPSSYDMFYDDYGLTTVPNRSLRGERVDTFELDADYNFTKKWSAAATVYHYQLNDLIQYLYVNSFLTQAANDGYVRAAGAALELNFRPRPSMEISASLAIQRAVSDLTEGRAVLPNSPGQVGKLRFSFPLWRDRVTVAGGIQALGQRQTYAGNTLPWFILPELVVTTKPFAGGLELCARISNLSNTYYRDPVGLSGLVDSMTGPGRSYSLSLIWRSARDGIVTEQHRKSKN